MPAVVWLMHHTTPNISVVRFLSIVAEVGGTADGCKLVEMQPNIDSTKWGQFAFKAIDLSTLRVYKNPWPPRAPISLPPPNKEEKEERNSQHSKCFHTLEHSIFYILGNFVGGSDLSTWNGFLVV